ncbi:hypothetical protein PM082_021627 [Marasmius tenuissimus]|nr:hypothetical protein PM082_021627 [Marasmius tenuissimus]
MPSLVDLSAELLAEIFKFIHDSSRHTLFSLLRVNKVISAVVLPFIYREMTFSFDRDQLMQTIRKLETLLRLPPESALWRGVKVTARSSLIGALASASPEVIIREKWGSFIQFLSRIVGLREVVFRCAERVPIILLDALEAKHPSVHLHVEGWVRLRSDVRVGDPYEEALARSPCLRSLQAHFRFGLREMDFNYAAFERIMQLSPSLEEFAYSSTGIAGMFYDLTPQEKAVEERERKRFRVARPTRNTKLRRIKWRSQLDSALLQRWRSFIDLHKVQMLELGGFQNVECMEYAMDHGTFSGLKHLTLVLAESYSGGISQDEYKSTLDRFLSSQSPLETLSIINHHGYINLSTVLLHHGASLRPLSLHQAESRQEPRPILSLDDLNSIGSEAPHLRHLMFDLNRTREPQ